jgi:beta-glucosidase
MGARIGAARPDPGDEFERAVAAAAGADVAVVVVGLNGQWESEGHDRPDLSLPGRQSELVGAVIDANPRTVVVVNAGSPVEMPWAQRAAAILMPWYAGEEGADAVADILVGASDPGGRLPITFPARLEDTPTAGGPERYPGIEGRVFYDEGLRIGYRHYDASGIEPLFAFGHGLTYGDVVWEDIAIAADSLSVSVRLWNRGGRRGTEVVQVYRQVETHHELAGFVKVGLDPGERRQVQVEIDAVDTPSALFVGRSSRDIRAT